MTTTWTCPAKVNLALAVLGPRDDGYHELKTVLQTIDLADRLTLEPLPATSSDITLTCDDPAIPTDDRNLVVRAWRLLKTRHPFEGAARVTLEKAIPAGGGLGGGSSDAAAMLGAVDHAFHLGLAPERLETLAAELGSDVPFFVRGGTRLGEGRGERLSGWPALRTGAFLVATPGFAVPTADVYRHGGFGLTPPADPFTILRLGMTREDPEGVARGLFNALERPAFSLHPALAGLKGQILGNGALGALLCGSGSSVFAYFRDAAAAEAARNRWLARGETPEIRACGTVRLRLALPLDAGVRRIA